jgi:hypothetical protein
MRNGKLFVNLVFGKLLERATVAYFEVQYYPSICPMKTLNGPVRVNNLSPCCDSSRVVDVSTYRREHVARCTVGFLFVILSPSRLRYLFLGITVYQMVQRNYSAVQMKRTCT